MSFKEIEKITTTVA